MMMLPDYNLEPPEDKRRVACSCAICDEDIYEGDDYYDIPMLGKCCTICIDDARRFDIECEYPDPDEEHDLRFDREED